MSFQQAVISQDIPSNRMLPQIIDDTCNQLSHYANLIDQGNNGVLIIHQYQTTITKLQSMIWMVKEQLGYEKYDFIDHSLKYLSQHFSKVRSMDVIMQMYHDNQKFLNLNSKALFDIIDQLQREAHMHALSAFDRKLPYLIIQEIKNMMSTPEVVLNMEQLDVKSHVVDVINTLIKQEGDQKKLVTHDVINIENYHQLIAKTIAIMDVFQSVIETDYLQHGDRFKQLNNDLDLIKNVTILHQLVEPMKFGQERDDVLSFLVFMDIKSKQLQYNLFYQ